MELIDKEKVVAEIERRIEHNTEWKDACKTLAVLAANQAIEEDKQILSIINSLEVKEVDLEKLIDDYMLPITAQDVKEEPFTQLEKCAKYFFELGMQQSKNDNTNENKN